jgi:DNA-directed RNA polymerase subunit beta
VTGRVRTYEAIVKGHNIPQPGIPESFKVLVKELQSLCLDVRVLDDQGEEIELKDDEDEDYIPGMKDDYRVDDREIESSGFVIEEGLDDDIGIDDFEEDSDDEYVDDFTEISDDGGEEEQL